MMRLVLGLVVLASLCGCGVVAFPFRVAGDALEMVPVVGKPIGKPIHAVGDAIDWVAARVAAPREMYPMVQGIMPETAVLPIWNGMAYAQSGSSRPTGWWVISATACGPSASWGACSRP